MTAPVRKDLLRRLNQLEQKLRVKCRWPTGLVAPHRIHRERREALAEGERIVLDWYRCAYPEGGMFWSRERITTNPSDVGRMCQPGRCLEDVMKELGEQCRRQQDGSCSHCRPGQYPVLVEQNPQFQAMLHWQPEAVKAESGPVTNVVGSEEPERGASIASQPPPGR
jgi:hypothetical protein